VTGDGYTVMVTRRGDSAWREPAADDRPWEYVCTVCGTRGVWGPSWSWFGSYKDADRNPRALPMFCADVCRDQWVADNGEFLARAGVDAPKAKGKRR